MLTTEQWWTLGFATALGLGSVGCGNLLEDCPSARARRDRALDQHTKSLGGSLIEAPTTPGGGHNDGGAAAAAIRESVNEGVDKELRHVQAAREAIARGDEEEAARSLDAISYPMGDATAFNELQAAQRSVQRTCTVGAATP